MTQDRNYSDQNDRLATEYAQGVRDDQARITQTMQANNVSRTIAEAAVNEVRTRFGDDVEATYLRIGAEAAERPRGDSRYQSDNQWLYEQRREAGLGVMPDNETRAYLAAQAIAEAARGTGITQSELSTLSNTAARIASQPGDNHRSGGR